MLKTEGCLKTGVYGILCMSAYCLLMGLPFSTIVILLDFLQILCSADDLLQTTTYQLVKFAHQFTGLHFFRSCRAERSSGSCCLSEPNSRILIPPEKTLQQIIAGGMFSRYLVTPTLVSAYTYTAGADAEILEGGFLNK